MPAPFGVATRGFRGSAGSWGFSTLGLVLMIFLMSPGPATGESYFIANDGDDRNPRSVPPSMGTLVYQFWDELFSDDFESGNANAWTTFVS